VFQAEISLPKTSYVTSKVLPLVSGALRNMWMKAALLKVEVVMPVDLKKVGVSPDGMNIA
jgi:hypothetical protein